MAATSWYDLSTISGVNIRKLKSTLLKSFFSYIFRQLRFYNLLISASCDGQMLDKTTSNRTRMKITQIIFSYIHICNILWLTAGLLTSNSCYELCCCKSTLPLSFIISKIPRIPVYYFFVTLTNNLLGQKYDHFVLSLFYLI